MVKAFLIAPEAQTIESVEVASLDDIKDLIGFDIIESDAVGSQGDRLYFDEECFLRGTKGRFQIDTMVPVAGKGVVVGTKGDSDELCNVEIAMDELRQRIKYL